MTTLSWRVPRWSYFRRDVRILRNILGPRSLARILGVSALAALLTLGAAKAAYPALELAFLWKVPLALCGVPVWIAMHTALLLTIRPFVKITPERIQGMHGNSHWVARLEDCAGFRIAIYSGTLRRLFFYRKGRRSAIGLDESVDLSELRALLPRSTRVIDARRRFARRRLLRGRGPRL